MKRFVFSICLLSASNAFGSTWDPRTERPEDVILSENDRLKRQIEDLKTCSGTLEDATNRMATIHATWLNGQDSKADLGRNFNRLVEQHRAFFPQIQDYLERYQNPPREVDALEAMLLEIERGHAAIRREQQVLLEKDDLFLASIPPLEQGLSEVASEYTAAKEVCDASLHAEIDKALKGIRDLHDALRLMTAYVAESGRKRSLYFSAKLREKRIRLIRSYAEAAGQKLEDVRSRIQVTLEADDLHRRAQEWWHLAAVRQGVAKGLGTRELRHFAAIRQLTIDLARLDQFERELLKLEGLKREIAREIQAFLEGRRAILKDELARLESRGWRGTLERQRLLTAARKARLSRYSAICAEAIAEFEEKTKDIDTEDDFRAVEDVYSRQLGACATEG